MVRASKTAPKDETVMIVLGCGVNGDRPSLMLTERLDAAYDYLNTHYSICIYNSSMRQVLLRFVKSGYIKKLHPFCIQIFKILKFFV